MAKHMTNVSFSGIKLVPFGCENTDFTTSEKKTGSKFKKHKPIQICTSLANTMF